MDKWILEYREGHLFEKGKKKILVTILIFMHGIHNNFFFLHNLIYLAK